MSPVTDTLMLVYKGQEQ